jgi:glucan 1,3-beta-glucosidase
MRYFIDLRADMAHSCSYLQAYDIVRTASGVGEGKGPFISFHEGFAGLSNWNGYFTNSDRVSYDIHPYVCFGSQSTDGYDDRATQPCTSWGANQNQSMANNGLTTAGEFSNAINDCGLFVNGVNLGTRFEGTYQLDGPWPKQGDCEPWTDYQSWTPAMKKDIMTFAMASMDALQV